MKHTCESDPDYQTLIEAKQKIDEVAEYINEGKRNAEAQQKCLDIQILFDPPMVLFQIVRGALVFYKESEVSESRYLCKCVIVDDNNKRAEPES